MLMGFSIDGEFDYGIKRLCRKFFYNYLIFFRFIML